MIEFLASSDAILNFERIEIFCRPFWRIRIEKQPPVFSFYAYLLGQGVIPVISML